MPPAIEEQIFKAQAEVSLACDCLLLPTPERLDRCTAHLQAAIAAMPARTADSIRSEGALDAARRLEQSLHRTGRLLETAWVFRQNWFRRLSVMIAGYAPGGEPAAMDRGCTLLIRG